MRADHLAQYSATHPEVPTMEEAIQAAWRQEVNELKRAHRIGALLINETYVHEVHSLSVSTGVTIFPIDRDVARMAITGELDR